MAKEIFINNINHLNLRLGNKTLKVHSEKMVRSFKTFVLGGHKHMLKNDLFF